MATETAAPSEAATAKFSRYRSVRRAQAQVQHPQPMPPVPPIEPQKPQTDQGKQEGKEREVAPSRSMSRYHRRPTTSHPTAPPVPTVSGSAIGPSPTTAAAPPAATNSRSRALSSPQHASHRAEPQPRLPNTSKSRGDPASLVEKTGREPSQAARDEAKRLIEQEEERQRRIQQRIKVEKRARLEAEEQERERQLRRAEEEAAAAAAEEERLRVQREAEEAETLRRQKEEQERGRRLQKAESAARLKKREEETRKAKSPPTSPLRHGGGLGLFSRRRKDDASVSPEQPAKSGTLRQRSESNNDRDLTTIRPGGGGAVLGIDAPISAINAGDRRVLVVRNKQEILLPVTPTTTPLDLIKSASNCLTEPIQVRTAVVLESFQKVGVKRPLRNYEHVRDVMNSWDDDRQNDLHIVDALFHDINQRELLASEVPDSKPPGMSCYMHHSSKPGKWSKRFFTFTVDGQLTMAKNESSKDHENICHLSDFDIYSPTDRKISKVRPPKKICYAVKSQQKSNIYLDETRFVHFFCTNDKTTASLFYKTLQGWRSWYLIHVMGEGQKPSKSPESKAAGGVASGRNLLGKAEAGSTSHARNTSVSSHYQLGSFMPLLDLDQFSKDPQQNGFKSGSLPDAESAPLSRLDSKSMHARRMSTRAKGPPPLSYSLTSLGQDSATPSSHRQNSLAASGSESESETFAASGRLGRKYTERQRAIQAHEPKQDRPFTEGPSLINSNKIWNAPVPGNEGGLARQSSVRSHHRTSSDIQRSMSTRARPRPLVDLTPQYKEPPQHARKGKAFIPEGHAGPLIENATSVEEAIKVPPSTDWRRPTTARPNHGTYGAGAYERTRSLKGRGEGLAAYTVNNHTAAPEDDSTAFTGGLLARAGFSQGHTPVGHGVMDGSKARGPMLDLRETSKFASGSLLAKVESQHATGGPVLDRTRRQSVDLG